MVIYSIRYLLTLLLCFLLELGLCGCSQFYSYEMVSRSNELSTVSSIQTRTEEWIEIPTLNGMDEMKAIALGDLFFFHSSKHPDLLQSIDANTGALVGNYQLLFSQENFFFRLKSYSDSIVMLTDRQALRIGRDGQIQQEELIPEGIQGICDIDRSLRFLLCQDGVDVRRYDLETDQWETLVVGDLEAVPQEIYTSPQYICDDQKLLLFCNVGSEYFSPIQLDIETLTLLDLQLSVDVSTTYQLQNDFLLVCDGLQTTLVEPKTEDNKVGSYFGEEAQIRVSGCYDLNRNQFQPIPLDTVEFGVQTWGLAGHFLYFFRDTENGQELWYYGLRERQQNSTGKKLQMPNLHILSTTSSGKLLVAYYDLQNPACNGVGILTGRENG